MQLIIQYIYIYSVLQSSVPQMASSDSLNYPGMERWKGRVAIITGASAGIGYELSKRLVQLGVVVVGCARNIAAIEVRKRLIDQVYCYETLTELISGTKYIRRQASSHKV